MPARNRRPPAKNNTTAKQTAPPRASRTSPAAEPPGRRHLPDQLLLDLHQVKQLLQMSRSSIYAAIADGDFPRPIRVQRRGVRWFANEIDDWVKSRPRGGGPA